MGFSLLILVATIATAVAFPINNQEYLVMPHGSPTGSGDCVTWRWAVETNNIKDFSNAFPDQCIDYIDSYMLGSQYRQDFKLVCDVAYEYAQGLNLTGDGKDLWVFDVDDTTLSCLPYFLEQGSWELNVHSSYAQWTAKGGLLVIPEALDLYNKLIKGDELVHSAEFKSSKRKELEEAGYKIWGNIGDQWTDITGTNIGDRAFKLPNPVYYVP
ncbi:hypothetical protein L1987_67101 [Smallanthus sonchifolius]|uniref:Uncharacterized protein n=1 Tax=Smallanthus sonchifolius TaxID=185202 RepID=A0ACB9BZ54_9ASTR|nr:hypothetical protein L1987_67101 [Smallanthus sonchifolius]